MVFVTVGDEEGLELVGVLLDITHVRNDEVDAEHFFFGKHEAAVDGDHVVAVLEDDHVTADLAQAAEWDYAEAFVRTGERGEGVGH